MSINPGRYEFGPQNGKMVVRVYREGMAKKAGHDLIIDVNSWKATADIAENPAQSQFTASVDVGSFNVREGVGGVKPLSEGDKADIKKNITQKILTSPEISFTSTAVQPSGDSATITGDMRIMGRTNPATVKLSQDGNKVKGTLSIVQSQWGIKPFQAMMGALKVKDQVDIELEANIPS
ncbi:MAG TPA: YceI family protein [Actinomycetota bacterium]|nr:YceI family protein [Actinomycetota bacterium]